MTICTSCKELLPNNPELWRELQTPLVRNALSRRDNQTYICNVCGMAEALADYQGDTLENARREQEPSLKGPVYRYFYLLRPPGIGCQPDGYLRRQGDLPKKNWARSDKTLVNAFGFVEYVQPLTFEQAWHFDLSPDDNIERAHLYFWLEANRDPKKASELESEYMGQSDEWLIDASGYDCGAALALLLKKHANRQQRNSAA